MYDLKDKGNKFFKENRLEEAEKSYLDVICKIFINRQFSKSKTTG